MSLNEQVSSGLEKLKIASSALDNLSLPLCNWGLTIFRCRKALDDGIKARELHADIGQQEPIKEILGETFDSISTNITDIEDILAFVQALDDADTLTNIQQSIYNSPTKNIIDDLIAWHENSHDTLEKFLEAIENLINTYTLDITIWFNTGNGNKNFLQFGPRVATAVNNPELLSDWITYVQNRRSVCDKGISDLVNLIEEDKLPADQAENALAYLTYFPHADELASSNQYLSQVNGDMLDELRSSYVRLDEKIQELNKLAIAAVLDTKDVPEGILGPKVRDKTELSLILNEVHKKARHIPIRQLVRRSGKALQALKPCWMMGPLSVAQYLEPGEIEFDLVIMDEASQMKPEDAIGCIARAKQVIVVGDPKQLPPTSFFSKNIDIDDDDDDLAGLEESESILDAANTVFRPAR